MNALVAIFSILYLFWPLTILFGMRVLFTKDLSFSDRLRGAVQSIFIFWCVWAFFLVFIYWQGREPILLMPEEINLILFGLIGVLTGAFSLTWMIQSWRAGRVRLYNAQKIEDLLALTPEEFEGLVADLFMMYGYEAQVFGGSSDHGVDVVVTNELEEKWIVQCKRYSGTVGEPVVRDLFGTMNHENAQRAYLITTGSFTKQAVEWAVGKPIVLYDGEALVKLIRRTAKRKNQLGSFSIR